MFIKLGSYKESICEITDSLKKFIKNNPGHYITIDITNLNLIDTVKVVILVSTFHFTIYESNKLKWIVQSELIYKTLKNFALSNMEIDFIKNVPINSNENKIKYISEIKNEVKINEFL